ncbi:sensor histidine kinase [Microtetraspora niveoalba]|uniref:sensor histidine kinase n=1 Tax=Microtetraspora niveoalba TaxID=46175 RepID=UPI000836D40D|nr:ATP-binding protein [Microtetraspora niveoalba]
MNLPELQPLPPPRPPRGVGRFTLGQWFLLASAAIAVIMLVGVSLTVTALGDSREARRTVVDVIDPAALRTLELSTALSSQETSVRAYGLSGDPQFLDDYRAAVRAEREAADRISRLLDAMPESGELRAELGRLSEASARWRREYSDVVVADVPKAGARALTRELLAVNTEGMTEVRAALEAQQRHLRELHDTGSARVEAESDRFYFLFATLLGVLTLALVALALLLRAVVLGPVRRLADQVREVAAGDFDHRLSVERPAELAELSDRVDAMRRRMLDEWHRSDAAHTKLAEQAETLRRSNAELEQFAYVASHDLQEPLRKVASFTQMLEQRYGDRLDDRARQYIGFAVDGAKRMQLLINDLLDFSRVGRVGETAMVDLNDVLRAAEENLSSRVEETGAEIVSDELPRISGNRVQLAQLLQNLIGNAVKFRSEEPPRIRLRVRREGAMWEFSCSDNGIGIEDKYSDRIFLIFQRLHPRDVYSGTGIGLALCKKIVEYHGGRIWVDSREGAPGTTFRWTLPALPDPDPEDAPPPSREENDE